MNDIVVAGLCFNADYRGEKNVRFEIIAEKSKYTWECQAKTGKHAGEIVPFNQKELTEQLCRDRMKTNIREEANKFWLSVKIGDTVHFRSSEGWVRCEVVDGTVNGQTPILAPKALVGPWEPRNLPHRLPNGQVRSSFWADNIHYETTNRPFPDTIFEAHAFFPQSDRYGDPRTMPVVDLGVPPMTKEQEEIARQYNLLEKVAQMAQQTGEPIAVLRQIRDFINENLKDEVATATEKAPTP